MNRDKKENYDTFGDYDIVYIEEKAPEPWIQREPIYDKDLPFPYDDDGASVTTKIGSFMMPSPLMRLKTPSSIGSKETDSSYDGRNFPVPFLDGSLKSERKEFNPKHSENGGYLHALGSKSHLSGLFASPSQTAGHKNSRILSGSESSLVTASHMSNNVELMSTNQFGAVQSEESEFSQQQFHGNSKQETLRTCEIAHRDLMENGLDIKMHQNMLPDKIESAQSTLKTLRISPENSNSDLLNNCENIDGFRSALRAQSDTKSGQSNTVQNLINKFEQDDKLESELRTNIKTSGTPLKIAVQSNSNVLNNSEHSTINGDLFSKSAHLSDMINSDKSHAETIEADIVEKSTNLVESDDILSSCINDESVSVLKDNISITSQADVVNTGLKSMPTFASALAAFGLGSTTNDLYDEANEIEQTPFSSKISRTLTNGQTENVAGGIAHTGVSKITYVVSDASTNSTNRNQQNYEQEQSINVSSANSLVVGTVHDAEKMSSSDSKDLCINEASESINSGIQQKIQMENLGIDMKENTITADDGTEISGSNFDICGNDTESNEENYASRKTVADLLDIEKNASIAESGDLKVIETDKVLLVDLDESLIQNNNTASNAIPKNMSASQGIISGLGIETMKSVSVKENVNDCSLIKVSPIEGEKLQKEYESIAQGLPVEIIGQDLNASAALKAVSSVSQMISDIESGACENGNLNIVSTKSSNIADDRLEETLAEVSKSNFNHKFNDHTSIKSDLDGNVNHDELNHTSYKSEQEFSIADVRSKESFVELGAANLELGSNHKSVDPEAGANGSIKPDLPGYVNSDELNRENYVSEQGLNGSTIELNKYFEADVSNHEFENNSSENQNAGLSLDRIEMMSLVDSASSSAELTEIADCIDADFSMESGNKIDISCQARLLLLTTRCRNADDLLKQLAELISDMNEDISYLTNQNNAQRKRIRTLEMALQEK